MSLAFLLLWRTHPNNYRDITGNIADFERKTPNRRMSENAVILEQKDKKSTRLPLQRI
jgi:hypothetical protein